MKKIPISVWIIVIPVILMILVTPLLPEQIPMQFNYRGEVNWYLDRKFAWMLGFLPSLIYLARSRKVR